MGGSRVAAAIEDVLVKTLFLDTNAVHMGRLYLDLARSKGIPKDAEVETAKTLLKDLVPKGQALKSYEAGLRVVYYLRSRQDSPQIEYAPVTRLELLCGLLRGQAMLAAAHETIPNRMWNRLDEFEILERLDPDNYEKTADIGDITETFADYGITVNESDPKRMPEVWDLSRHLLGCVYLDVGDCVVYASALLAQADELLTKDEYFRTVVNGVRNPNGNPVYERAQTRVMKFLQDNLSGASIPLQLPVGINT